MSFRAFTNSLSRNFRQTTKVLRSIFKPIQRGFMVAFFGLWNWGKTRHWVYFFQALPAIVVLITVIVLLSLRLTISAGELKSRYKEAGKEAFKAKNYPLTRLSYERLVAMGGYGEDPADLYKMAVTLDAMGDKQRALRIMNELAPAEGAVGYGDAHLWMAGQLRGDLGNDKSRKLYEVHLEKALDSGTTDNDLANIWLGELYARTGEPRKAEKHLANAVKNRPDARMLYAQILAQQKKTDLATEQAEIAAKYYRDRARLNLADRPSRISWAETQMFLEDFPGAIKILEEGWAFNRDPVYRVSIGNVYVTWQRYVAKKTPDDIARQLDLLEQGLAVDPTNAVLLSRLIDFIHNKEDDRSKQAREALTKIAVDGKATPAVHFLLGLEAHHRGDDKVAYTHWDTALKFDPNLSTVANNLAWLLGVDEKPGVPHDRERALNLISLAIEKAPGEITYLDTRANIYIKMEKWKEAQLDLVAVLRSNPNFPNVHKNLALVYDRLGVSDLAEDHRRRQADIDLKKGKKK